jgi:pyruvate/2-oxoglutarate dehydrogenase complex dihydrolipoamide dehydrogenase (E3) component
MEEPRGLIPFSRRAIVTRVLTPDICVIGGGAGGLTVAAGASQMGASVVLIERGKMGGDCLNTGCVPSKALLAAAHAAHAVSQANRYGVVTEGTTIDFQRVKQHIHETIDRIAINDSVERFTGLGVQVLPDSARFTGRDEVEAGGVRIRARRFIVATGTAPAVPPIRGLDSAPYLTNETIFDIERLPDHLIVVGGGPIGVEISQAFRRLGARVTIIEMLTLLGGEDPELVDLLRTRLLDDGVTLHEGARVDEVERSGDGIVLTFGKGDKTTRLEGSHLLIATGRRPNVDRLDLDAAGIEYDGDGIRVDRRLRTTNPRVHAIGDVTGGAQFTHRANYHATVVLKNALFRLPAKVDETALPRVTYTSPELASAGLLEDMARQTHGKIRVLRWPFAENDRARAELETSGLIKVVVSNRGRILGVFLYGPKAGELIQPWLLAMRSGLKIGALASFTVPYPTLGEVSKRAAGSYYTPSLFGERTKWLVRFLARFG